LKHRIKIPAYSEIFTPVQWLTVAIFGYLSLWTVSSFSGGSIRYDIFFFGPISFSMSDFQNMLLLVLFTYFAVNAHDLPEGIHDFEGDKKKGVRTYATSFGPQNAAKISFLMFIISGIFALILFYRTILSPFFLITFLIIWFYVLYHSYHLVKTPKESRNHYAKIAGRKGYDYFLMAYNLIFLDILLQIILHHTSFSM
jgi:4-hydroxybenzoate polyprenyltransferase